MEIQKLTKQNKSDDQPVGTPIRVNGGTPGDGSVNRKQQELEKSKNVKSEKQINMQAQAIAEASNGSGSPILASAARNDNSTNEISLIRQGDQNGNRTHQGSSEKGYSVDVPPMSQPASRSVIGTKGENLPQGGGKHLSNKSDSNLNQPNNSQNIHGANYMGRQGAPGQRQQSEGRKKRKSSEKRRASNNRKESKVNNENHMPPVDSSGQRSNSRGGPAGQQHHPQEQQQQQQQYMPQGMPQQMPQFFDQANFNPFAQQQQNQNFGQHGFPFGNNGFGNQQAPQVHFIAKKQQFIAQISPDQLMNGDKRPYTAQNFNNLSANAKRAGSVYANAMSKAAGGGNQGYNLANAAMYMGNAQSKTHTNGFSFHPPPGHSHKYANSIYGDDVKPKIAGKDILKALGSSNGFSSGYGSDPYNSVMSSGFPPALTNSNKQSKAKAPNRLLAREKEQLYDEAIKMKMLNNQMKEDNVKLKTKVKILENELSRKEKTIEDLFSHNQLIQQSHQKHQTNSNQNLVPIAQTAQKYQQETFLVMSLKKQIRELKYEVVKRDEELEVLRKNIKNTSTQEFEQEIQTYHEECLRLRAVLEDIMKQGANHPAHKQPFIEQVNTMQAEINQKDILIRQLSENLNQAQLELDKSFNPGTSQNGPNQSLAIGSAQLAAVKSQDSQNFETHPSEMFVQSQSTGNGGHGPIREKSQEKKHPLNTGNQQGKDVQKELQRARKMLREKEKDNVKMRTELAQLRKNEQEQKRTEKEQNNSSDNQVKTLKDKLKEKITESKRKDEKLAEAESKAKTLVAASKSQAEQIIASEDQVKQVKAQLRALKHQQTQNQKQKDSKKEIVHEKDLEVKEAAQKPESSSALTEPPKKSHRAAKTDPAMIPKEELAAITLIGQREKLCRDDLTAMMLAGEESLRMLIREPTAKLIHFIKANLQDEDHILSFIPRFEMPKADFESQVLREMRIVLRENFDKISEKTRDELLPWNEFESFYHTLEDFEYPHKDKLLEFIKYFFLDHIVSPDLLMMNYMAFKEHLLSTRPPGQTPEKSRNGSNLRSGRKSEGSMSDNASASADGMMKSRLLATGGSDIDDEKHAEEERMLDIAEQCFMRIADLLHIIQKTVRAVFLRYSQPENFKDGSILELMSPRGFLEGIKDLGFDDITELEAACLMKVLAKPELENAIILNEFVLIMENFGIPPIVEEDEAENDYAATDDEEEKDKDGEEKRGEEDAEKKNEEDVEKKEEELNKTEATVKEKDLASEGDSKPPMSPQDTLSDSRDANLRPEVSEKLKKFAEKPKNSKKHPIVLKFDILDEKATKILKKLARFLLERYMHPREFFGPTIKKETFGSKKCKVEIIKHHDFYLRLKLASIRKKLKENVTLNQFLAIDDDKHPGFMQVKRMIKGLEVIAESEQQEIIKEQEAKDKEMLAKLEEENKEREARGDPTLTEEEWLSKCRREKEEEEKKKSGDKEKQEAEGVKSDLKGKPPTGLSKGALDEMVKLGGKGSPKGADKDKEARNRFASHLGAPTQLNTIEEDLHETQTSHYSYKVKQGEESDRDSSRHGISTSNHLRNSNTLNELEDSSRRSAGGPRGSLPHGVSVGSGDYSGGSHSGSKKGDLLTKDIDTNNIAIADFQSVERRKSDMTQITDRIPNNSESLAKISVNEGERADHDKPQIRSQVHRSTKGDLHSSKERPLPTAANIAEEKEESDPYKSDFVETGNVGGLNAGHIQDIIDNIEVKDLDTEDDQRLKDELDHEVDKKYKEKIQDSFEKDKKHDDDDDYEEDFDDEHKSLKQDTIQTNMIEQIVNDEHGEAAHDVEEYSYHDDATHSEHDAVPDQTPKVKKSSSPVKGATGKEDSDDYEEDYEF